MGGRGEPIHFWLRSPLNLGAYGLDPEKEVGRCLRLSTSRSATDEGVF